MQEVSENLPRYELYIFIPFHFEINTCVAHCSCLVSLFTSHLRVLLFVHVMCCISRLKFENLYSIVHCLHTSDSEPEEC